MFKEGGKAGKVGSDLLPARAWHVFPCLTTAFCQRCQSLPAGLWPARQGGSPRSEACVTSPSCPPTSRGLQASREPHMCAVAGFARTLLTLAVSVPRCWTSVSEPGTGALAQCRGRELWGPCAHEWQAVIRAVPETEPHRAGGCRIPDIPGR